MDPAGGSAARRPNSRAGNARSASIKLTPGISASVAVRAASNVSAGGASTQQAWNSRTS